MEGTEQAEQNEMSQGGSALASDNAAGKSRADGENKGSDPVGESGAKPEKSEKGRSGKPRPNGEVFLRDGKTTNSSDPKMKKARLFVGNLAADRIRRNDLLDIFGKYGEVTAISIHRNYAFVQFAEEDFAQKALDEENGRTVSGQKISKFLRYCLCVFLSSSLRFSGRK